MDHIKIHVPLYRASFAYSGDCFTAINSKISVDKSPVSEKVKELTVDGWGVSRNRMTLSSQRLWWRDQEGPWCWGREGPWCGGGREGPWCGGRSRSLWSSCLAWWHKEEVHGNRTTFHLLLVEQIEYPLQMKGWWESNKISGSHLCIPRNETVKPSYFQTNYNVLSPSAYTHISARDLYISRIGLSILLQPSLWTDPENI